MTKTDFIICMGKCLRNDGGCAKCLLCSKVNCKDVLYEEFIKYMNADVTLSEPEEVTKTSETEVKFEVPESAKSVEIVLHF